LVPRVIELPLQRSDDTADRLGAAQKNRVVVLRPFTRRSRAQQLCLPGHSQAPPHGQVALHEEVIKRHATPTGCAVRRTRLA